jgi:hypothetical protein
LFLEQKAANRVSQLSALTYSYKEKDVIINYIKNQHEHHKGEVFADEMNRFFKENGIDEDEKWFWQDE